MKKKSAKLVTGVVIFPEDCVVVEQTKTEASDYVGVVTERWGNLPRYIVFSDKPFNTYCAAEEEKLREFLGTLYPEIEAIRSKEVEAVYKEGVLTNAPEWQESLRLISFAVPEIPDLDHLDPDLRIGIIREA